MNESFGARLRRERERQHITLGQIAASTKIQASLFEGLERNDVSRWPGGIFRRSFIRAYAEAIGLNSDQICREFLERFPEPFPDGLAALALGQGAVVLPPRPAMPPMAPSSSPRMAIEEVAAEPITLAKTPVDAEVDLQSAPRLHLAEAPGDSAPIEMPRLQPVPVAATAAQPDQVRWYAAAIDVAAVLLVAALGYVAFGTFWAPLAVASLLCSVGATLLLGQSLGSAYVTSTRSVSPTMATTATPARVARPSSASARPAPARARDIPEPSQAREALDALEVLTLESLTPSTVPIVEASDVPQAARPAAYPALPSPFDLERRRRARA